VLRLKRAYLRSILQPQPKADPPQVEADLKASYSNREQLSSPTFDSVSIDLARYECASFRRRTSARRQRAGADELLEQLDHFRLAGNFSDSFS
jgi:hypothetical protein